MVFNFILSILVFASMLMFQGRVAEPLTVGALTPLPAQGITLEPGNALIRVLEVVSPYGFVVTVHTQGIEDVLSEVPVG